MKTRNFPAKKLARQLRAQGKKDDNALDRARSIRTKKNRSR